MLILVISNYDVLVIPFQTSFLILLGTLLVELEGMPMIAAPKNSTVKFRFYVFFGQWQNIRKIET